MIDHFDHLSGCYCRFISGLRRGHQIKSGMSLVPDQCLLDPAISLHYIYQIVYDTVLQTHNHIQVT